jgi:hypothetical protein
MKYWGGSVAVDIDGSQVLLMYVVLLMVDEEVQTGWLLVMSWLLEMEEVMRTYRPV